jgi:hypothetical protein
MDTVIKDLIGDECHVFVDDVVVFSRTAEKHTARLQHVLERFGSKFAAPPSEMRVCTTSSKLLGIRADARRNYSITG